MSTARFCRLTGLSERSYRRWQARERQGRPVKGPWPSPSADRVEAVAVEYADRFPQWGSRTIATLLRLDGHHAPDSTVYRALKRTGRVLRPTTRPNDASTLRLDGRRSWAHPEPPRRDRGGRARAHRDRTAARHPLLDAGTDHATGEIRPVCLVTDNGPCFRSGRFAAFVDGRPELIHIRTRRNSPGQNGVRERAFGSLKYEHLYRHEIDDGHQLGLEVETYRQLHNTIRPHQTLNGRRPLDTHLQALQDPQTIKQPEPETLPTS